MASFSLTTATFILVAGRLGDIYGFKPIFIGGLVTYALWSSISGATYFLRTSNKLFMSNLAVIIAVGSLLYQRRQPIMKPH